LPWRAERPVPPWQCDSWNAIAHCHFEIVKIGAMPRQKKLLLLR
jgi:hypothetical protein